MMNSQDLSKRCMLVSLHISVWTATRQDKKITQEVANKYAASPGKKLGHYLKQLLPQEKPSYDAVHAAAGAARSTFYAQTLPWSDEGSRILTAENFLPYSQTMRQSEGVFNKAMGCFLDDYPLLIQEARQQLAGLWKSEDYPSVSALREKFSFATCVLPLPCSADFRVSLTETAVKSIRSQIEVELQQSLSASAKDTWSRLQEALLKMHDKLSQGDAIYRDTLFTNLEELCDLLPRLNLFADKDLDTAVEQVRDKVLRFRPQQCRDSKPHRQAAAKSVEDILKVMEGF